MRFLFICLCVFANIRFGDCFMNDTNRNHTHHQRRSNSILIPRSMLISGDDYRSVRLSPDGRTLAWLAPYMGVSNVWIRRLIPASPPFPLTKQKSRPIRGLTWAFDVDGAQTIIYSQDLAGEENYRLFAVNTKGDKSGQPRLLTPALGVRAQLIQISPRKPNRLIVALNDRNQSCHDYYIVDIRNGRRFLYLENTECFAGALFDDAFNIRLLAKENLEGGMDYYKVEYEDANQTSHHAKGVVKIKAILLKSVNPDETSSTMPLQVDGSGKYLYWLDASETDKGVLVSENLHTGHKKILYEPESSELVECTFHPMSGRPLIVYESYLKPIQSIVSTFEGPGARDEHKSITVAWRHLKNLLPPDVVPYVISASYDFSVWLVVTQTDSAPVDYWLYRGSNLQYLFSKNDHLNRYELSKRRAIEVPMDDGLTELCYLSLPAESVANPDRSFRPKHPLPMVLFVHGGPWARDRWGFHNEAQLLSNRGYAVLQCNYRGSVGLGKSFANAGDGQWGLRMQRDLTDAVHWAIREKIAREDKVAIAGFSYGGYAALEGLTSTPDLYACGVDAVGPSNLLTLMRTLPPYWTPAFNMFKRRLGADPMTDEGKEKLKDASPYFHADRIRRPLLVAHGVHDPRVKLQESDMIVRAAKSNNVSVTYVTFSDEGHGFRRSENNLAFWALTERFLRECLGGKSEPILDAVEKSSAHFVYDHMMD